MLGIDKMYEDIKAEEEKEATVNLSEKTIENIATAILEKLNIGLTNAAAENAGNNEEND